MRPGMVAVVAGVWSTSPARADAAAGLVSVFGAAVLSSTFTPIASASFTGADAVIRLVMPGGAEITGCLSGIRSRRA